MEDTADSPPIAAFIDKEFDRLRANVSRFSCRRGAAKTVKKRTISRAEGGQLQAPVRRQPLTTALDCKNASASIQQLI